MSSLFSVDGLVSGLDTSRIIAQLMAVERRGVSRMEDRQRSYDARIAAWGDIGAKVAALRSALDALTGVAPLALFAASSTNTSVLTATAGPSAQVGSTILRVTALAAAHQLASAGFASSGTEVGAGTITIGGAMSQIGATGVRANGISDGVHTVVVSNVSGNSATVTVDGTDHSVTFSPGGTVDAGGLTFTVAADGLKAGSARVQVVSTAAGATLADLATAIAAAGGPATAQLVDTGSGTDPWRLVLTATATGTANALTVALDGFVGLGAGFGDLRAAADATITMGNLTITRPTNTVGDLIPGVTLQLVSAAPGSDVTVNVTRDADAVVKKVKALVDALNEVVKAEKKYDYYDPNTKAAGVLLGDSAARRLLQRLLDGVHATLGSGTYTTIGQLGVTVQRDGTYALDEAKLRDAIASDFDAAAAVVSQVATTLKDTVVDLQDPEGLLATAKGGAEANKRALQQRIDRENARLELVEARYRRQFARLEQVLGQLRDQSTALAGQINGLFANRNS
jgi:flagellar hook-associated protein 2